MNVESYSTVSQPSKIELVINKSRFIGSCFPVKSEEEALCMLDLTRRKHYDATHNCYAYAIGSRSEIARFSDDGEPGGTAGMPMMEVLKQRNATDLLVVVTRYFGGILLGAGGLVRAYSKTTAEAVTAAIPITMMSAVRYDMEIDYTLWGKMENLLRNASSGNYLLHSLEFVECVRASVLVLPKEAQQFLKETADLSDGRIAVSFAGEQYHPWKTSGR